MAAIEWSPPAVGLTGGTQANAYKQAFGYSNYGAVTRSKLTVDSTYTPVGQGPTSQQTVLQAAFTWSMQGELASITYPSGRYLYYKFDAAGRANGLHQNAVAGWPNLDLVTNTSFTPAGQLANPGFQPGPEHCLRPPATRDPHVQQPAATDRPPGGLPQRRDAAAGLELQLSGRDEQNGRVILVASLSLGFAEINNLTNTTVSDTYNQLNRLATAVSATGTTTNWGLSFSYDCLDHVEPRTMALRPQCQEVGAVHRRIGVDQTMPEIKRSPGGVYE